MKQLLIPLMMFSLMLVALTALLFGQMVRANAEGTDFMALMESSIVSGDDVTGRRAEIARTEKIIAEDLTYQIITYEDLSYLSKIICAEAGSEWLSDEWKMGVGEIVLNRVASPEFPNCIREVVEQPGQYYGQNSRYFKSLKPTARCVSLAKRLLQGERTLKDPTVVFQANFTQGGGTHLALYDKYLGWTYFCHTSKPSLYEGV